MEIHKQLQRNRLAGKVVIVTGVGEEGGRAIAQRLAAEGARLLIADADEKEIGQVLQTIDQMGGTAERVVADVLTDDGARKVTETAGQIYGRLDALVHNLMLCPRAGTNGTSATACVAAFYPLVFSAASAMRLEGEGSIVLTAHWCREDAGSVAEAARERAREELAQFIRTAAARLFEHGLTVNAVELDEMAHADGLAGGADVHLNFVRALRRAKRFVDMAQTARFLASSESRGVTGQTFVVGGGMLPAEPANGSATSLKLGIDQVYSRLFGRHGVPVT